MRLLKYLIYQFRQGYRLTIWWTWTNFLWGFEYSPLQGVSYIHLGFLSIVIDPRYPWGYKFGRHK